jgi:hypothetical protein
MRALSIIGMILSIIIIVASVAGMALGYVNYKNAVYSDFGEYGGYVRHFDPTPFLAGAGIGFVLLILSIIGMVASRKKTQPVVNVYNQQPAFQQQPQQQYHTPPQQQQHHTPPQQHHQPNIPPTPNPNQSTQQNTPVPPQNQPTGDIIAQLERLGKLKDQKLLTEDEFNDQKKKLLS